MASVEFSVEAALNELRTPGFLYQNDLGVGTEASGTFHDIDTEAGIDFYKNHFLGDARIADTLNSVFGECQLVDYRTFKADPSRIFQFRRGGEEAGCILVALLWPPESEIIYYGDSMKHSLTAIDSDNGLMRVPHAAAKKAGCGTGTSILLKQGGLTIQDGRTLVTFVRGQPITATFATDAFLRRWHWKRRVLSVPQDMAQKLKASETPRIKLYVNIAIVDEHSETAEQ